jgi:Ca2+-binding EF-hand superfamily protein
MLNVESIQQVAMQWMELADKDGNGYLDLKEFSEFFTKIEGVAFSQEEIKQVFNDFDATGDD